MLRDWEGARVAFDDLASKKVVEFETGLHSKVSNHLAECFEVR